MPKQESVALSARERELTQRVADLYGLTLEQAASALVQAALARRVRKRTGKAPARVYSVKGRA